MWAGRLGLVAYLVAVVRCDWLGSPLALTPEKAASSVAYAVLGSGDELDSTCYPGTEKMQRADVALAYPNHSPFCSGSLVQGPQSRTFILTARHCANPMWEDSIYPIRSYFVLFDYKLRCNASEARPATFQKAVQGVSLLYMDIHTDTMVLELHSDVPPEWGQYTAGIHAIFGHSFNRTILGLGHLGGDAQKFHAGDVIGACNDSSLYTKEPEHVDCTKHNCGFYQVLMHEGNAGPGCSGSGVVDEHGDALVGILNGLTDNLRCPTDFPDNDGDNTYSIYGSLAATWQHGMYAVFEGERDKPPTTTYQPHKRPVPTISIGNTSPVIYPAVGPTHVSIKLQQPPLQSVVSMTVKNLHPQLIATNTTQLIFTSVDWNVAQIIELVPGPRTLKLGQADEFGLVLRWNVVREDGVEMHRTKHIRGMIWNAHPGSDMVTQLPIALPFSGNYDLQDFLPDKEIGREIGNADPAVYFQYTPETTQGINATVCWRGGPADRRNITVKVATQSYLSHSMQHTEDSVNGCTSTVALLARGEAVTLVARRSGKPNADKIDPFPSGVSYPFSVHVEPLPIEQTLFELTGPGGVTFTDESKFVFDIKAADTRPTPIIIRLNETTTEIISTCYAESMWPADIALLDDDFNVLRVGEEESGLNCQAIRRQQLIGNRTYFLEVKPAAAPALVTSTSHLIKVGMQPYSS